MMISGFDSFDSDQTIPKEEKSMSNYLLEVEILDNFSPSLYTAQNHLNKLVRAMNSYNMDILYQTLTQICTVDVKIFKRVYSLSDPHIREKGLQDTCFNSIEEFLCFMEVLNTFIPDGIFSLTNNQMIVPCLPTFVFICNLHFTGRKIVRTMNFFLEERLECYFPYLPQILTAHGSDRPHTIRIEGSMTMFVNEVGLINKIEFYLTEI